MPKPDAVMIEEEAFELLTFLVTSARIQMDEPAHYAPMRLLSAAERLTEFIATRASPDGERLLTAVKDKISGAHVHMNDADRMREILDDLCRMVATYLVEQEKR